MNFKQWFNLSESTDYDQNLIDALINYQQNLDNEKAKSDFYSAVTRFVKMWCANYVKHKRRGIDADNLASEIVEKLLSKIKNDGFLQTLQAEMFPRYLSTMIGNKNIDIIRREKRREKLGSVTLSNPIGDGRETQADIIPDAGKSSEQIAMDSELAQTIKDAIDNLKRPEDKELAKMFFYQGMKYEEISERLGIPIGTVKSGINSLRAKLKAALTARNIDF